MTHFTHKFLQKACEKKTQVSQLVQMTPYSIDNHKNSFCKCHFDQDFPLCFINAFLQQYTYWLWGFETKLLMQIEKFQMRRLFSDLFDVKEQKRVFKVFFNHPIHKSCNLKSLLWIRDIFQYVVYSTSTIHYSSSIIT